MSTPVERTILFVDLRGSTSLYLRLGNAQAASVVTQSLTMLGQIVARQEVSKGSAGFNTSALPAGVYIYSVALNGERLTGKVIITH